MINTDCVGVKVEDQIWCQVENQVECQLSYWVCDEVRFDAVDTVWHEVGYKLYDYMVFPGLTLPDYTGYDSKKR